MNRKTEHHSKTCHMVDVESLLFSPNVDESKTVEDTQVGCSGHRLYNLAPLRRAHVQVRWNTSCFHCPGSYSRFDLFLRSCNVLVAYLVHRFIFRRLRYGCVSLLSSLSTFGTDQIPLQPVGTMGSRSRRLCTTPTAPSRCSWESLPWISKSRCVPACVCVAVNAINAPAYIILRK